MVQTYDIVIVGGSLGGAAAALHAGSLGFSVCLLEPSDWLGGQYSAQGVTKPDENRFIETVGSSASYRAFRQNIRLYYRKNHRLSRLGSAQPSFNPGGPFPGFGTEPRVAHNALLQWLQALPPVHVRLSNRITGAQVEGDQIESVTSIDAHGNETSYVAKYFLDATDLGDLLPLVGAEFSLGAESRNDTNEPSAPPQARPDWIQPISVVVSLERRPSGEVHTIPKPAEYEQLKAEQKYHLNDGYIDKVFVPGRDLWSYRRYIAAANFNDPVYPCDLSMLNMGANDYQNATLPTGVPEKDRAIVERARQASLGFVYWLQTECPRDDGNGKGYPELKIRSDQFQTTDGTAAQPYIRESRRVKARYTVVQQDLDEAYNAGPRAKNYDDSCGIGLYGGLNIHGLRSVGMPQQFIKIKPFEIPLRALIPVRMLNLLPACKNIGVTHITNGAYRLHPVEWNVGEAAGALASFALRHEVTIQQVPENTGLLRKYQRQLLSVGAPLFWWTDVPYGDPAFAAVQLCGVSGIMHGTANDLSFLPQADFDDTSRSMVEANLGRELEWPDNKLTRGQAAAWVISQLGW